LKSIGWKINEIEKSTEQYFSPILSNSVEMPGILYIEHQPLLIGLKLIIK